MLLDNILFESDRKYSSAVAVVRYRNHWLLGLSTATDLRRHKWCFPGGHVKTNETLQEAAIRETREELGITVHAVDKKIINDPRAPHVAFVYCRSSSKSDPKPNSEFSHAAWFTEKDMKGLQLLNNVLELIRKAKNS